MLDMKLEYEYMKEDIDSAIRRCLEHQQWILGPEVKEFEKRAAEYIGVRHCIGCSSGTEALVLSLRALAIKTKGQEYFDRTDGIITAPFTFTATGDAILRAGATPVFVDIDPLTFNIDAEEIRKHLLSRGGQDANQKVAGIIAVHLYGLPCSMDDISETALEHDLFIVEDVAQAFGGTWKGKKLGAVGDTGAFSFFPSKNLGGFGDGGMVTTGDDEIAGLLRMLLKHGGKDKYNVEHIGYNARLDTLQAAIVLAKLKYIDEFNRRRAETAELYTNGLKDVKGIVLPAMDDPSSSAGTRHARHQYTLRVLEGKRDRLRNYLKGKGISAMLYYPVPLHKMKVFAGRMQTSGNLIQAEKASAEVLSLPIGPLQDREDTAYVIESIKNFFQ
jgi:dTDP-4-amino-4,6-dideoxygalactose transaminase